MDNLRSHKLLFNRSWATFDNFLPKPILDSLLAHIAQAEWTSHPAEHRQVMNRLSVSWDPAIDEFFRTQVTQLILQWTGEQVKYVDSIVWKDTEGLTYKPHIDRKYESNEHHVQVYLTEGSAELGTRVHAYLDKHAWFGTELVPYKLNSGVYINTVQTIRHSVKPVPVGSERVSIRARYV